jgi:hypothetical protein
MYKGNKKGVIKSFSLVQCMEILGVNKKDIEKHQQNEKRKVINRRNQIKVGLND